MEVFERRHCLWQCRVYLNRRLQIRIYDISVFGQVDSTEHQVDSQENILTEDGVGRKQDGRDGDDMGSGDDDGKVCTVTLLGYIFFQDQLVENFNIIFKRGNFRWTSRRENTVFKSTVCFLAC